jgi:MFS family permease
MTVSLHKIHYKWFVLTGVCGIIFANSVSGLNVLTVFFLPMSEEFSWNRTQMSGAASIGALLGALTAVYMGRLFDRIGPRTILTVGGILTVISLTLVTRIDSLIGFYVFFGIARISDQGFIQSVSPPTISTWFDRNSGKALAILFVMNAAGGVVLPILAQIVIGDWGWRSGWGVMSGVMLCLGLFPVFFLVRTRNVSEMENFDSRSDFEEQRTGHTLKGTMFSEALRTKEYWFLAAAVFVTGLATAGIGLHIVPFLVDQGLTSDIAVGAVSIRFLASALGGFVAGMVVDRFSPRMVVIASMIIRAVSILILIYANTLIEAYISGALGGFSEGAQSTVLVVLLVSYFGRSNVGGIYGLNRALTVVGFSAGPMIAGIAYDVVGSYFMVFWAFLILTLIGIALIINAKQSVPSNR